MSENTTRGVYDACLQKFRTKFPDISIPLGVKTHNDFDNLMALAYADLYFNAGREPENAPLIKEKLFNAFNINPKVEGIPPNQSLDYIFRDIIFRLRARSVTIGAALAMLDSWINSTIA